MGLETRGYPLSVDQYFHQLKSNLVAILSVDMLVAKSLLPMWFLPNVVEWTVRKTRLLKTGHLKSNFRERAPCMYKHQEDCIL